MRILAFIALPLALVSVALADIEVGGIVLKEGPQDLVQVKASEWAWGGGAESYPCISFVLKSGRFTYQIRHDRKSGNGTVGLSLPTQCNWYQAGMMHLLLDGKRFELLPANGETVQTVSGRKGMVRLGWENEQAKLQMTFVLVAGEDRLFAEMLLEPKTPLHELAVDFQNYVSGFNREPKHVLWTPVRTLDQPGRQALDVGKESAVFFSDVALDPETNPAAAGPSAFVFDATQATGAFVNVGGYGVSGRITYKPEARRLRFCLWEYPARGNAEALEAFRGAYRQAAEEMMQPGLFDVPAGEGGAR
ncbi:hypothetical protein LLH23_16490 [bacterium]|nr:hypothetical protein [bacterium]